MKQCALFIVFLLLNAKAFALSGYVYDNEDNPISNAKIEIVGSSENVRSDRNGYFEFDDTDVDEIHIEAIGYSHQVLHLHGEHESPLKLTLKRTVIEQVDVIGIPLHASTMEAVQPISVLSGTDLRNKQASTLGETLKNEVGIHSTYFGPVASSPIVRGLDGPRVLITQNGLDVGDASRVGPDHVVATEASTAKQIEVLRGPATLIYGSGAIGGVVNVVDDRIPTDSEPKGAISVSRDSVSNQKELSSAFTGGNERFAFHVDGFIRENDDYEIPGEAELEHDEEEEHEEEHEEEGHEEHAEGILENSASESYGFNIGGSVLLENGHIGISYGQLDRINGIPGHAHEEGHDDDHDEEEHDEGEEEHEEHGEEEEIVLSDLEQERLEISSQLQIDGDFISSLKTRLAYTDYTHAEIENGEEGTRFSNESTEFRADILHQEISGWRGAISLMFKSSDFEAVGEEAFTSPSKTDSVALALMDEKHFDDFLLELGARVERVSIDPEDTSIISEDASTDIVFDDFDFTPVSVSAGWIWDYKPAYKVSASLTYAERAPTAAELFSLGPHIATGAYEIGATFDLVQNGENFVVEHSGDAEKEISNNLDLSWRKHEGDVAFVFNVFYNQISNFYYERETGLNADELSIIGGPGSTPTTLLDEEIPVYIFEQSDAKFYGVEGELAFQLSTPWKLTLLADSTRGKLDNGENLPRIPPVRFATQMNYATQRWSAELSAARYFDQNDTAVNETSTDGYTMVDANLAYNFDVEEGNLSLFLKIANALDSDARVHSSFIKDVAPLPGRNFTLGIRGSF